MKCYSFLLFFLLIFNSVKAQPASDSLLYPRVGRPCPDFILRNIKYYSKQHATLSDFKGKWLLLSFWNKSCGGCVASFPTENRWHQTYGDQLQFISVGIQDKEKQIEPMFVKYREKENLTFPVSFDSLLAKRWNVYAGPYFILIDPQGIVRTRCYLPSNLLKKFMAGASPKVPPYNPNDHYDFEKDPRTSFDDQKPFLVNGNGGKDATFSYRSLIAPFDCETQMQKGPTEEADIKTTGQFSMIGWPLMFLYNYAWYGFFWPPSDDYLPKPVINVKDTTFFTGTTDCDKVFSYNLNMPAKKISKEKVMKIMRQDLENYFGFTGTIDEEKIPALKLVATEIARKAIQSKGGTTVAGPSERVKNTWVAKNLPLKDFISKLHEWMNQTVIDSSLLSGYIDITLSGEINDHDGNLRFKDEVIKALRENGLDLLPAEVSKKVLVIRDAKE